MCRLISGVSVTLFHRRASSRGGGEFISELATERLFEEGIYGAHIIGQGDEHNEANILVFSKIFFFSVSPSCKPPAVYTSRKRFTNVALPVSALYPACLIGTSMEVIVSRGSAYMH